MANQPSPQGFTFWCIVLRRVAIAQAIFSSISFLGFVINFAIGAAEPNKVLMALMGIQAVFTVPAIICAILGIRAFGGIDGSLHRYTEDHSKMSCVTTAISILQLVPLCLILHLSVRDRFSDEPQYFALTIINFIQVFTVSGYVLCIFLSCFFEAKDWRGGAGSGIVLASPPIPNQASGTGQAPYAAYL